ncbi:MAG: CHAD domain-containing protein, partial [Burkholderiales bacterium]
MSNPSASAQTEFEIKLEVPAARRAVVQAAVATATAQRTHLQAVYFDTADGRLAAAGVALLLRREGPRWVQTLKAQGALGAQAVQRLEHNVPVMARGRGIPALDLARHAGSAAGEVLAAVLQPQPGETAAPALIDQYRTDIWRTHRVLRVPGGSVELAFDIGRILAQDGECPVCELEIELLSGPPQVVIDVARRWAARHGLWLDVRSQAERGELLARGLEVGPVRKARRVQLQPGLSAGRALQAVVGACLAQILANASALASGRYGDEHVHQLRVALRRLRSALRLFRGWTVPLDPAVVEGLAGWFRQLGAVRDQAALAAAVSPALQAAGAPVHLLPPDLAESPDPAALARSPEVTQWLLALLAFILAAPVEAENERVDLSQRLAARLQRWHRELQHQGRRFEGLDEATRHALRKRAKRLRYGVEFAAALLAPKATRRYLKQLAELQDVLGRYADLSLALTHLGTAQQEL